jgi:hypothetical protein
MDTNLVSTEARRAGVYLDATETAKTEAREIRAEVAALEARIVTMRGREASLDALVDTLRGLLPARTEAAASGPAAYQPVEMRPTDAALEARERDAQQAGASNGSMP